VRGKISENLMQGDTLLRQQSTGTAPLETQKAKRKDGNDVGLTNVIEEAMRRRNQRYGGAARFPRLKKTEVIQHGKQKGEERVAHSAVAEKGGQITSKSGGGENRNGKKRASGWEDQCAQK